MAEYIPLEQRVPATVRAAILARSSDPSSKAEDMRPQLDQCLAFIRECGWPEPNPAHIFTESKSGMRNVARPMLDELLTLVANHEIDVVVCRELERVARSAGRRTQVIVTAQDYGVEFRFANLASTGGKLPDDQMSRMWRQFQEAFGEAEAERLRDRLGAPKEQRIMDGLPHGGRAGALYGYTEGERREGNTASPQA